MRHRHTYDPNYDPPEIWEVPYGGVKTMPDEGVNYKPLPVGAPSLAQVPRPIPWRYDNLLRISNFTVGVERDIIGGASPEFPFVGPVPFGMRAMVDFFKPIAIDAFSRSTDVLARGTVVLWRIYVDNRPIQGWEVAGIIPGGLNEYAGRSLFEMVAGQRFKVTITVVSNGMGLTQLGARIAGIWDPITYERPWGSIH